MKLESLNELFTRLSFETPDYQRGYAWEESHVRDFWEDIERIGIANPQHFTGTLILEVHPTIDKEQRAIIVDGQQRITTAILLIAVIAELLETRDKAGDATELRKRLLGDVYAPKFRYGKSHDSWPYFALKVLKDNSYVAKAAQHESAYTKNLDAALTNLAMRVKHLTDDEVSALLDKLEKKLLFNVVEVDPAQFNIHVAFESINHRGKKLTDLELLKNRLIYLATILRIDGVESAEEHRIKSDLRDAVNATWADIYSWLGREGKIALDEDEFLRTHSLMYFDVDSAAAEWLENVLFKLEFSPARAIEGDIKAQFLRDYLNSLRLAALLWSHIRRPRNMPANQIRWLERISHVHRPLFDPLLLAAYMRLMEGQESLATNLTLMGKEASTRLVNVLKQVERFIVLIFYVSGHRSHTGRKDFYGLAHKLFCKEEPFDAPVFSSLDYVFRH